MEHEKIFKLENGDRLKAIVYFSDSGYFDKVSYRLELSRCEKGKKKFFKPYDDDSYRHRALSMGDRQIEIKNQIISILGKEKYNECLMECWQKLKPQTV